VAAGALQAVNVPVLDDPHLVARHHRDQREPTIGTLAIGLDADADQVRARAAAAPGPSPRNLEPAFHRDGALRREDPAREHDVRPLRVHRLQRAQRERRQVHRGETEAGHPPGRAVGDRDALDQPEEVRRRRLVAAEPPRHQRPVYARRLEQRDDAVADPTRLRETLALLAHRRQQRFEVGVGRGRDRHGRAQGLQGTHQIGSVTSAGRRTASAA
jgi:hypothetical protein